MAGPGSSSRRKSVSTHPIGSTPPTSQQGPPPNDSSNDVPQYDTGMTDNVWFCYTFLIHIFIYTWCVGF
jgi:hypothetical protein